VQQELLMRNHRLAGNSTPQQAEVPLDLVAFCVLLSVSIVVVTISLRRMPYHMPFDLHNSQIK
jgi:hypothetical protein